MSDTTTIRKQLRIKSGSAKRLYKEHRLYQKEEEELKRKLDKHIADDADNWSIGNTRRMMEESGKMIVDSSERLGVVTQALRELVVSAEKDPAFAEDEDLAKAREVLEEVSV